MEKFGNPLDSVRVASSCRADWNQMYGTERVRHCGECRMNVYNLSAMTRDGAEALLLESEGRLCVRFYRRADGTILTNDCPVGLAAVKIRVRKVVSAAVTLIFTFLGGLFSVRLAEGTISLLPLDDVPAPAVEFLPNPEEPIPMAGEADLSLFRQTKSKERSTNTAVVGRVEKIGKLEDTKVVAWIK